MTDDKLLINDLLVRGIVGLNDWEREKKQDILINLTVFVDTRAAGESDDVKDSLNYRTLTKAIIRYVEDLRTTWWSPWWRRSPGSRSWISEPRASGSGWRKSEHCVSPVRLESRSSGGGLDFE